MRNERTRVAYLRLLSGAISDMGVLWKKGHGAGPQKQQPQL